MPLLRSFSPAHLPLTSPLPAQAATGRGEEGAQPQWRRALAGHISLNWSDVWMSYASGLSSRWLAVVAWVSQRASDLTEPDSSSPFWR